MSSQSYLQTTIWKYNVLCSKQVANQVNSTAGQSMLSNIAIHKPTLFMLGKGQLISTAMEFAQRPSQSNAVKNLKYKVWDGMRYSRKVTPMTGTTAFSIVSGRYGPNPGINFADPMWYPRQIG